MMKSDARLNRIEANLGAANVTVGLVVCRAAACGGLLTLGAGRHKGDHRIYATLRGRDGCYKSCS